MSSNMEIIEHLKLIQGVINRMAQVSFMIKGWTLTISIVLLGFAVGSSEGAFGFLGLIPIVLFWGLDAYYLKQEHLYRKLYSKVREQDVNVPSYSMDTTLFETEIESWWATLKRPTLIFLYLILALMMIAVSLAIILTTKGG